MSRRTRIKICGLTREADVDAAVEAGADALGFVLYPKSPRAVTAARAGELAARLPGFVTPVLLFVNASAAEIAAGLAAVPQALLQFHGDESPEACQAGPARGRPYLRAARMTPELPLLDFARAKPGQERKRMHHKLARRSRRVGPARLLVLGLVLVAAAALPAAAADTVALSVDAAQPGSKIDLYSRAASRAASISPWRMSRGISPARQAVRPTSPFECSRRSCLSMRGS